METTPATVDRISTADLMRRYNLQSRTGLANRLNALKIAAYKEGKSFFVPVEAIDQLDALAECLKSGAKLDECALAVNEQMNNGISSTPFTSIPTERTPITPPINIQFPSTITLRLLPEDVFGVELLRDRDPLQQLRSLTDASDNGWHLPTSLLLELLNLRSLPRKNNGLFQRLGFTFERVGRAGRETTWLVTQTHTT